MAPLPIWRRLLRTTCCFASLCFVSIALLSFLLRSRKKSGVSSFSFSISKSPFFNRCVCPPPPPPPQKKTITLYKLSPGFERTLPHPRSKTKTDALDRSAAADRRNWLVFILLLKKLEQYQTIFHHSMTARPFGIQSLFDNLNNRQVFRHCNFIFVEICNLG